MMPYMLMHSLEMVTDRIAVRFPWLGHDVTDENLNGIGLQQRFGYSRHDQIRENTGVQASGSDENSIRIPYGLQNLRQRLHIRGLQKHPLDTASCQRNLGFPLHNTAVIHLGLQNNRLIGCRKHPPADSKHPGQGFDPGNEISRYIIHRRQN
ncbi:hypothetical protein D3C73_1267690 [compost metagenome]